MSILVKKEMTDETKDMLKGAIESSFVFANDITQSDEAIEFWGSYLSGCKFVLVNELTFCEFIYDMVTQMDQKEMLFVLRLYQHEIIDMIRDEYSDKLHQFEDKLQFIVEQLVNTMHAEQPIGINKRKLH